jgi:hypothetical protein
MPSSPSMKVTALLQEPVLPKASSSVMAPLAARSAGDVDGDFVLAPFDDGELVSLAAEGEGGFLGHRETFRHGPAKRPEHRGSAVERARRAFKTRATLPQPPGAATVARSRYEAVNPRHAFATLP